MTSQVLRERFATAQVAVLGTSGETRPHLVPVVFAMLTPDVIVTAVDSKPKTTKRLQRIANIERDPHVTLLADRYDDDWSQLWWVRADGAAAIRRDHAALAAAQGALAEKYSQYRTDPPEGPVIEVTVSRWTGWSAS